MPLLKKKLKKEKIPSRRSKKLTTKSYVEKNCHHSKRKLKRMEFLMTYVKRNSMKNQLLNANAKKPPASNAIRKSWKKSNYLKNFINQTGFIIVTIVL